MGYHAVTFSSLEKEVHEEIKKWKEKISQILNCYDSELKWATSISTETENPTTVILVGFILSDYKDKPSDELAEMLSEAKEELEELLEELDDIADLDDSQLEEYDFDSAEDYQEHIEELECDIFVLESEIELIEEIHKN